MLQQQQLAKNQIENSFEFLLISSNIKKIDRTIYGDKTKNRLIDRLGKLSEIEYDHKVDIPKHYFDPKM